MDEKLEAIYKRIQKLEFIVYDDIKYNECLSLREAAEFLKISEGTLRNWTSQKLILYYKPRGKNIYFLISDLYSFILNGKVDIH